jgi:phosphoribosylglycinamide formyltransferase-1
VAGAPSAVRLETPLPARLVVLASGTGTTLQALLDASADPGYPARVVAVATDRAGVAALRRGEAAGVPTFVVPLAEFADRGAWDAAFADAVAAYRPDLVVCAGFMRILGPAFLARFAPRIVNTHPALLPAFPGAHAVRDALAYGVRVTGATVHLVDDGVDTGPVVAQEAVPVCADDDEATLHERVKAVERRLLPEAVARLTGGFTLDGRTVLVG